MPQISPPFLGEITQPQHARFRQIWASERLPGIYTQPITCRENPKFAESQSEAPKLETQLPTLMSAGYNVERPKHKKPEIKNRSSSLFFFVIARNHQYTKPLHTKPKITKKKNNTKMSQTREDQSAGSTATRTTTVLSVGEIYRRFEIGARRGEFVMFSRIIQRGEFLSPLVEIVLLNLGEDPRRTSTSHNDKYFAIII